MKKLLISIYSFSSITLFTSYAVSCLEPGNNPFEYIPHRISGSFDNLIEGDNLINFIENDQVVFQDYSPLISRAIASFGSDKFSNDRFRHLKLQFISEFFFYNHFALNNKVDDIYDNLTLQDNKIISIDNIELKQIIRIKEFQTIPTERSNNVLYFPKITLEKYKFFYTNDVYGNYQAIGETKVIEIYINDANLETLDSTLINITTHKKNIH